MIGGEARPRADLPTVLAISVLAYTLGNLVHEGLGHGGVCLLVGCKPVVLNAIFFNYDDAHATLAQQRWISAGGTIVNLLVAAAVFLFLRSRRSAPPAARFFLWLFGAVNLLTALGYPIYSGVGGIGDWAQVVTGLEPPILYRAGLALIGGVLYFGMAPRILMPPLEPFLGRDPAARLRQTRRLCLLPYLAGGTTLVIAGLFNPLGARLVLISAAASSFGGTSLLAWYFTVKANAPGATAPASPVVIERSAAWIAAGILIGLLFVFGLGPGIAFGAAP